MHSDRSLPGPTGPLTAYQTLIVREARRFNYRGWLQYDQLFQQHTAQEPDRMEWGKLNTSLFAITFLSRQMGETQTCTWCMSSDHHSYQCALQPRREDSACRTSTMRQYSNPPSVTASKGPGKRPSASPAKICYSWNDGHCAQSPNCLFRHVSYKCEGEHKALECTAKIPRMESAHHSTPVS